MTTTLLTQIRKTKSIIDYPPASLFSFQLSYKIFELDLTGILYEAQQKCYVNTENHDGRVKNERRIFLKAGSNLQDEFHNTLLHQTIYL